MPTRPTRSHCGCGWLCEIDEYDLTKPFVSLAVCVKVPRTCLLLKLKRLLFCGFKHEVQYNEHQIMGKDIILKRFSVKIFRQNCVKRYITVSNHIQCQNDA